MTPELVRDLLRDQHPDLAGHPVRLGAQGWDNQLWRVGDDLAVRIPCNAGNTGELLLREYALLPDLAPRLPLPVPVPQRLGRPSERFPRPWIVTTWVAGEPADRAAVTRGAESADLLAAFLTALHRPDDAPAGRHGRGGPLAGVADGIAYALQEVTARGLIAGPDPLRDIVDDALAAPAWTGPPVRLHADLHPANVLTRDGRLAGVVDFGDTCAGDPALDLAAGWALLPGGAIGRFRERYPADAATWRRARGWAVWRALACLLIASDDGPGGKPGWGPPAQAALRRLGGGR